MTPEQKKRAQRVLDVAAYAVDLIKDLIDAPEQAGVPVCRVSGYFGGYLTVETIDKAAVLPNGMALYAAPQAPAVQETWPIELCEKTLSTLTYIRGIAERGEGRPMRDDETLEQFLLGYVKRLEAPAVQAAEKYTPK